MADNKKETIEMKEVILDEKNDEKIKVEEKEEEKPEPLEQIEGVDLYDKNTIKEYKALISNFDSFKTVTGMFAGFEGFIINGYTGKTGDSVGITIQVGLLLLMISLVMNVFVSITCVVCASIIKWGYLKRIFIPINAILMFMTGGAAFLFVIAFNLYISQNALFDWAKILIYCLTGFFLTVFFIFFLYMLYDQQTLKREHKVKMMEKIV